MCDVAERLEKMGIEKGLKQGIAAKRVIRQADFAPTVAAMLGIRMPEQNEGGVLTQLFA